jgi:bisphosphoglycerate-dependent phosphoglycerate mutase
MDSKNPNMTSKGNHPRDMLRVTLHEDDLRTLMEQFPKLSRTEISDVISNHGPLRADVERALERISERKR